MRSPGPTPRSAAVVDSDITFIVTYRCPTCHSALEARTSQTHTWLRCPQCGRASLPPEFVRTPPPRIPVPGEDVLIIGADAVDPRRSMSFEAAQAGSSGRRIAMAIGIFISVAMLMISFLDGNPTNVGIFGVTTIVLLAVAAYLGRGR